MEIKDLKKTLAEKEELAKRTEIIYHQLQGQIVLLKEQVAKAEKEVPKDVKEEEKK